MWFYCLTSGIKFFKRLIFYWLICLLLNFIFLSFIYSSNRRFVCLQSMLIVESELVQWRMDGTHPIVHMAIPNDDSNNQRPWHTLAFCRSQSAIHFVCSRVLRKILVPFGISFTYNRPEQFSVNKYWNVWERIRCQWWMNDSRLSIRRARLASVTCYAYTS